MVAGDGCLRLETEGVPSEVTHTINAWIEEDDKGIAEAWILFEAAEARQTRRLLEDFIPTLERRLLAEVKTKVGARNAARVASGLQKKLGHGPLPLAGTDHFGPMQTQRWAAVLWALAQGLGEDTGVFSYNDPYSPASLLTLLLHIKDYPGLFVSGDTVYASDTPTQMHRGAGGLHNENGPALQWQDGYEQYWLFNQPIPKAIYEARTRDYATPKQICAVRDRGIRDALIQAYGYEAFVRDTAMPQVRPWVDPATGDRWSLLRSRYRSLLGLDNLLACEPPARADSSPPVGTAKTYTRVPFWHTTAQQAWKRLQKRKAPAAEPEAV